MKYRRQRLSEKNQDFENKILVRVNIEFDLRNHQYHKWNNAGKLISGLTTTPSP